MHENRLGNPRTRDCVSGRPDTRRSGIGPLRASTALLGAFLVLGGEHAAEAQDKPRARKPAVAVEFQCEVERVADGDTFSCRNGTKVRGWSYDAPEKAQPYGPEARNALALMVTGKKLDCIRKDIDRYGRWVAACTADGADVGEAMVAGGHAWNSPAYGDIFRLEEASAWCARAGLWKTIDSPPPWTWREAKKSGCGMP